jgi:hypothetical protein
MQAASVAALSAKHQTVVLVGFEVSNIEKVHSDGWQGRDRACFGDHRDLPHLQPTPRG